MQRLAFLSALLFLYTSSPVTGDSIAVLLGDPVKFPATENCQQENAELHLGRRDTSLKLVAWYENGAWKPGAGYEDRVPPGASVTLKSSNMNDQGLYELTCRAEATQLDVLVFHERETEERKAVTLQCHFITAGGRVESVWWEKGGKLVIRYDFSTNQTEPGPGYEEKVSLTQRDPKSTGDFSLILEMPLHEDQGDYLCRARVNGVKARGSPAAARLKVHKAGPDQTKPTAAPPPGSGGPGEEGAGTECLPYIIALVLVLALALALALALCRKRLLSLCSSDGRGQTERPPSPHDNARPLVNGYEAESRV